MWLLLSFPFFTYYLLGLCLFEAGVLFLCVWNNHLTGILALLKQVAVKLQLSQIAHSACPQHCKYLINLLIIHSIPYLRGCGDSSGFMLPVVLTNSVDITHWDMHVSMHSMLKHIHNFWFIIAVFYVRKEHFQGIILLLEGINSLDFQSCAFLYSGTCCNLLATYSFSCLLVWIAVDSTEFIKTEEPNADRI